MQKMTPVFYTSGANTYYTSFFMLDFLLILVILIDIKPIRVISGHLHYAQKGEAHKRKCQRKDYLPNTAADSSSSVFSTAYVDFERNRQGRRTERSPAR